MDLIEFNNKQYPKFQAEGFSAQYAFPFAKKFCIGKGYDIGCNKKEWALPGSIPIDISFSDGYNALNLPEKEVDYVFSSHCLEHLDNWITALNYWIECVRNSGILFLYLPDYSQEYWRPWNNKKHLHCFTPNIISDFLQHKKMKNILVSGIDLNNSFTVVCEK